MTARERRPADEPNGHRDDEHISAPDRPGHGHEHRNEHGHEHGHEHGLAGAGCGAAVRAWAWISHVTRPHSHDSADKVDSALAASRDGIRTLWVSLVVLGVTVAAQAVVALISGSVALLGDTLHNSADALTAVPLGVAFLVGRRPASRSYTYGYGRAEDLAGIAIVVTILASACLAGWQAIERLVNPATVTHLPAVALAGVVGFVGNEWVAQYRIRVGRRIGSAALVADGLHARTDGFTSLAVVVGAAGIAIGWRWADPAIGLAITIAILLVLKDAATQVYRRLMDAVDPAITDQIESTLHRTCGVLAAPTIQVRWIGHQLHVECAVAVDRRLSLVDAHAIAVHAEHALLHAIPRLTAATIHTDPATGPNDAAGDHHAPLAHNLS
jgi:cation diffusion facilitator family transporter